MHEKLAFRLASTSERSKRSERGEQPGIWLAFPFDGDAAWNEGARDAVLILQLTMGGPPR